MIAGNLGHWCRRVSQQVEEEAQRLLRSMAIPLRATTWKCGRVERPVVNYLKTQLQRCGRTQMTVKDIMQHFDVKGKQKNEFLDILKRLERHRIFRIEAL
jgi:hypothetical protein